MGTCQQYNEYELKKKNIQNNRYAWAAARVTSVPSTCCELNVGRLNILASEGRTLININNLLTHLR